MDFGLPNGIDWSGIVLLWPWMLLLLPLPLLVRLLWRRAPEARAGALPVPFFAAVRGLPGAASGSSRGRVRRTALLGLMGLAWIALVVAAARPQWIGEPVALPTEGRDLMMAVDVSGSMEIADMQFRSDGAALDRLTAVKLVGGDFLERRAGDRLGLILFGSRAYLQTPLTADRHSVHEMLRDSAIGLAGTDTALGDAIGLAVKHLKDRPADARVLVLLTDGVNTAGALQPEQAARLARDYGIRIHTIGIGSDRAVVQTPLGPRRLSPDSQLDEAMLRRIADTTGGTYFRARDAGGLAEIYARIDALEPTEGEPATLRPTRALHAWPLALAMLLSGAVAAVHLGRVGMVPQIGSNDKTIA
ncbi:vWA domain-containing protein [Marinibaculum pumilum]|uniref:VWA domain-containing protein n=1 Tax=Marinibaculum pumilum TaxID=1766165 RepID=A0ABV7L5K3_9PROT